MNQEKRKLTREQYLQALGLLTLATHHRKIVEECIEALGLTVGDKKEGTATVYDWSSEAVYQPESIEWLIDRVGAEVETDANS